MCGIGALFDPWGQTESGRIERDIRQLMAPIAHRGPDGEGVYVEALETHPYRLAFGHRRLAILDLSPGGHQPMAWGNRYVISFNGEIYNYRELRLALSAQGFSFRTDSDTEVLLAAYAAWGEAMLDRLNGMWAFVLWDRVERRLLASRDRFGIKPLLWSMNAGLLQIASEPVQLIQFEPDPRVDLNELGAYLYAGKVGAEPARTFVAGLQALPPGSLLRCSVQEPLPKVEPWYSLQSSVAATDSQHASSAYGGLLEDAVRLRLRSDVPVGSCLSGGLDSTAVVMLAARLRTPAAGPLHCIHALANEPALDESHFARTVADSVWARLHCVAPDRDQVWQSMDTVIKAQQEPFASPSIFLQYFVMAEARRQGCTVMLDGQGADETLLGYSKYITPVLIQAWRQAGPAGIAMALRQSFRSRSQLTTLAVGQLLAGMLLAAPRGQLARRRMGFLKLSFASSRSLYGRISHAAGDPLQTQLLDIFHTNLPALLRYEDRNSMAHSIEARLPFLDYRVVEAALAMPVEARIHNGWSKYPLRSTSLLPDEVRWRTTKLAFNAPDRTWLGGSPQMRDRVLNSPLISDIANRRHLERSWSGLTLLEQWRLFNVASWAELMGVRV